MNNLDTAGDISEIKRSRHLAISLPFHISSINKLFWSEYQDRLLYY